MQHANGRVRRAAGGDESQEMLQRILWSFLNSSGCKKDSRDHEAQSRWRGSKRTYSVPVTVVVDDVAIGLANAVEHIGRRFCIAGSLKLDLKEGLSGQEVQCCSPGRCVVLRSVVQAECKLV
ncbi:hypothetical protein Efla_005463 [Eimeria flavescens]